MNCTKHPDREASGICIHCGKFFCSDCLIVLDGKNYCRNCLSELFTEMKEGKYEGIKIPTININASSSAIANTMNTNDNTNSYYNANYNAHANYNTNANLNPDHMRYQNRSMVSNCSKSTALLLCVFLGYFGAHHFYARKAGMGLLYFFTFGLFGIGWLVDIIRIASGSFKDSFGLPLIYNDPIYAARYQRSMAVLVPGHPMDGSIPEQPMNNPYPDDPIPMNDTGYVPCITWDSYCRISSGMSYPEVCMLLGQEGIPVSSHTQGIQSYQWNGADKDTYALLRFSNGTLVDKEQRGLR